MSFVAFARRAAGRYRHVSRTAMYFARGKMAGDPVYRQAFSLAPAGQTVVDIGCGQGMMLALFLEASRFQRLVGIEMRRRMAYLAREALGSNAEIIEGDARTLDFPPCAAVMLFDVLHMMPFDDQETLMRNIIGALEPGGVILIREADASAGWRFEIVHVTNEIKARFLGTWVRRHYRTLDDWLTFFRSLGLTAEVCATETKNPLANVLVRCTL